MTSLEAVARRAGRRRRAGDPSSADEDRPPLQVEFAGGHRIAVETEAVVRRESILNTVGSLALILPLLYLVFRSLWLVPSARCRRRSRWCSCSACSASPAPRCRRRRRRRARCCSASASTASCCCTSPTRLAVRQGRTGARRSTRLGRTCLEHAARHVDDGGDVLRPDVRRLPQPQQLGALIGHSMVVCGVLTLVLVPALLPLRRPARAARPLAHAGARRWVERHRRAIARRGRRR